jgi:membrane fusion protein (multidrug efflux system)
MDKLKESTDEAQAAPGDKNVRRNVRRLDLARTERRSEEPRMQAPGKIEAREASPTSSKQKPDQKTRSGTRSRRSLLRPVLFALLPIALVVGAYLYVTGGAVMETDNAYIQADTVAVSTDVSGMVQQVLVTDNQKVLKGGVLFKLDPKPYRFALERAEAQVGTTKNDLLAMQASYRNMEAQVQQAKADVDFNMTNFKRQEQLLTNNFTPRATYDAAKNTLQSSQQKLASLQQQLEGLAANLNGDPNAPIEDHPRYKDAVAARDEAARQLDHTTVRAPFDGVVTNVPTLQPGQYLAASTVAFNLVSSDHVWVQANPKETELTYVKSGQKATIEIDTYPGVEWSGTVDSISPASSSSFSLLPAENSSGNWVKVVQRIPLRVRVQNEPGKPPLRVGMSVELNVDTGHARGLPQFITKYL